MTFSWKSWNFMISVRHPALNAGLSGQNGHGFWCFHWFFMDFHCFRGPRFPHGIYRKVSKMGKMAKIHEIMSKKCLKSVHFPKNEDFRQFCTHPALNAGLFDHFSQFWQKLRGVPGGRENGKNVKISVFSDFRVFHHFRQNCTFPLDLDRGLQTTAPLHFGKNHCP